MAANNAFSLLGATPAQAGSPFYNPSTKATVNPLTYNPSTKATPNPLAPTGTTAITKAIQSLAAGGSSKLPTTVAPAPKATTPVKAPTTPTVKATTQVAAPVQPKPVVAQPTAQPIAQPTAQPTTPAATTPPPAVAPNTPPTYGGLIGSLADRFGKPSDEYLGYQKTATDATRNAAAFAEQLGQAVADVQSNPEYSIDTGVGLGNRIAQTQGLKMQNLNSIAEGARAQAGLATSQQQAQQAALGTAAGLMAPQQVPYSNQYIDPTTGLPVGGGAAGGSLQSAAQNIAQRVAAGEMSYDAGVQALSGYGAMAPQALLGALPQGFNVQQSNANAAAQEASIQQTGTVGGQLTKSAETVKAHMQTLQDAYKQLTAQYGLPVLNAGVNAVAKAFGSGSLQSYNIALDNVRSELAKVLGGGTATDSARSEASRLLPENMTPAQITAAVKTATELMDSKINEYTKAPTFNTGGGSIGWDEI